MAYNANIVLLFHSSSRALQESKSSRSWLFFHFKRPKLKTKHGFLFHCSLVNCKGKPFFSGSTWGEFAKIYKFIVGMKLHFDISTHGPIIKVDLDNDPIVHPCECFETHVPCLCVDLQLIVSLT